MQHSHNQHDEHSPTAFKQKFLISLLLMIPTLFFSATIQSWLGLQVSFAGSEYIPAILGTVLFFYGGIVFLRGAWAELAHRQPGMMTLVSLAISVAFLYSIIVTLRITEGMDFWWELATLITIMLLGHWIEMASISRAEGALTELAKLLPDMAEREDGNGTRQVPVADLKLNDRVIIRPGTRVAADGVVEKGVSDVDESMLTGESKAIKKSPGMPVIAGTVNAQGVLTVKVTKVGDDTVLAGIMRLVKEAQESKSKTQILADKAAFFLTFVALGVALVTAVVWILLGASAAFTLERIVTVLVIACPHALGLAIPLVTAISTTLAARHGILVRNRLALEAARDVDVVLFDKTGTVTEGRQGVVDIISESKNTPVLALAASAEASSEHSIAKAITRSAADRGIDLFESSDFVSLPGRGVRATIHGRVVHVGGSRLATDLHAHIPSFMISAARRASIEGKTAVYVIEGHRASGVIMIADTIRKESHEAIKTLQTMGKRVALLTGDNSGVAQWVARELGILEYYSDVLPEDKARVIKDLQTTGSRVAMVGDGVNDAPALAQADVGIAIGGGTDVAIESAGIIIATNDPRIVAKIITLSNATYKKMKQNLFWATGYNVVAIPLAAGIGAMYGVMISPAAGAVLMSVSTIVVAINAQRLRKSQL